MKNAVFRVDASGLIGIGHLMRCLTLADKLHENGCKVTFISRELPGNMCSYVERKGYAVYRLSYSESSSVNVSGDSAHAGWLGTDCETDAEQTIAFFKEEQSKIDWLIVDHYALDSQWEVQMRPFVNKIMVIDDLANRKHDCDILLDQNLYENLETRYNELVPNHCKMLLGPQYALLRSEFMVEKKKLRKRDGRVRRILIFFGGSDPSNETEKALEAIRMIGRPDIAVDVVVGNNNPHKARIKNLCYMLPNTTYHCQADNMAQLMAAADLAIGAGGTTNWERSCMGLPSIVITVAENQVATTRTLANQGCVLYLGDCNEITSETITKAVSALLLMPEWLLFLGERARGLVDSNGLEKVVRNIWKEHISLRSACEGDREKLYHWRNAMENRRYSHNNNILTLEEHNRWFDASLSMPNRIILIGEINNESIGVIRYDLDGVSAKISIYLVPDKHGKGYGGQLIEAGTAWLKKYHSEITIQLAEVLPENLASVKAFLGAGFQHKYSYFEKSLV